MVLLVALAAVVRKPPCWWSTATRACAGANCQISSGLGTLASTPVNNGGTESCLELPPVVEARFEQLDISSFRTVTTQMPLSPVWPGQ